MEHKTAKIFQQQIAMQFACTSENLSPVAIVKMQNLYLHYLKLLKIYHHYLPDHNSNQDLWYKFDGLENASLKPVSDFKFTQLVGVPKLIYLALNR